MPKIADLFIAKFLVFSWAGTYHRDRVNGGGRLVDEFIRYSLFGWVGKSTGAKNPLDQFCLFDHQ